VSYAFPKDQENGKEVTLENGVTYRFNSLKKSWEVLSSGSSSVGNSIHTLSHTKARTTYGASATYLDPSRPKDELYKYNGDVNRNELNSTSEVAMLGSNAGYSGTSISVRGWTHSNDYRYFWFHPSHIDLSDAVIGDSLILEASNGSMFVATVRQAPYVDSYTGWSSIYILRWFIQGPENPIYTDGDTELKVYLADEKLNAKGHTHVVPRIAGFEDRWLKKWKSLASSEFSITSSTSLTPSENSYLPGFWRQLKQIKLYGGQTGPVYEGPHEYVETNNFGFISICSPTGSTFSPNSEQFKEYNQWSEYARTHERIPMYLGMTASSQRKHAGDKTYFMWNLELPNKDSHNPTEGYVYSVKHMGIIDGSATVVGSAPSSYSMPEELSDESDYLTANQMGNAVEEAVEMAKKNPTDKNLEDIKKEFQKLYGTQY
jgi:hypothetical protein